MFAKPKVSLGKVSPFESSLRQILLSIDQLESPAHHQALQEAKEKDKGKGKEKKATEIKHAPKTESSRAKLAQLRLALQQLIKEASAKEPTLLFIFIQDIIPNHLSHNTERCLQTLKLFEQHGCFKNLSEDDKIKLFCSSFIPVLSKFGLLTKFLDQSQLFSPELAQGERHQFPEVAPGDDQSKHNAELALIITILTDSAIQAGHQDALLAKNWVRILNYIYRTLKLTPADAGVIFSLLKNSVILPAQVYLIDLIAHFNLLGEENSIERGRLFDVFAAQLTGVPRDPKWMQSLFQRIYEIKLTAEFDDKAIINLLDEMIANISSLTTGNTNEIDSSVAEHALLPLVDIIEFVLRQPQIRDEKTVQQFFASVFNITNHLVATYKIDPFKISVGMNKSFFDKILAHWLAYTKHPIHPAQVFIPHHGDVDGNHVLSYQLAWWPSTEEDVVEDKLNKITCYTVLTEFLPLCNDEAAFISHAKKLFPDHLGPKEIQQFRKNMLDAKGLMATDAPSFDRLKDGVKHQLEKKNINLKEVDFESAILKLFNIKQAVVLKKKFDTARKMLTLVKQRSVEADEKEGVQLSNQVFLIDVPQSGEEKSQSQLLIDPKALLKIAGLENEAQINLNKLQMQLFLHDYIQILVNSSDFTHEKQIKYFSKLPEVLCQLERDTRTTLLSHLLVSVEAKEERELKRSHAKLRHDELVANEIFKALAIENINLSKNPEFKSQSAAALAFRNLREKFEDVKEQIKTMPLLNRYRHLFFYHLFDNNINPEFCESFINRHARKCIIDHIKDPNFIELYRSYEQKPSEHHLIRLIGIPDIYEGMLDAQVFKNLNDIRKHVGNSEAQEELYSMLRKLIIQFDVRETAEKEHALFKNIMAKIENVFSRIATNHDVKMEFTSRVAGIIASKKEIDSQLDKLIQSMKPNYPLIDDVCETLDEMLSEKTATRLLNFIKLMNEKCFTYKLLDDDKSKDVLQRILRRVEEYPAEDKDAQQVISTIISTSKIRNLFNSTTSVDKHTWLQFAWSQKPPLLSVIHQLILSGVNVCIPFKSREEKDAQPKDFIDVFFAELIAKPELIQKPNYRNIFVTLFTKVIANDKTAQKKLANWIQKSSDTETAKDERDLECKASKESPFVALIRSIQDRDVLKNIALELIKADRFGLLKILDDAVCKSGSRHIWDSDGYSNAISVEFDACFRAALGINSRYFHYSPYMSMPVFFTSHNKIIGLCQNKYPDIDDSWLRIALGTTNNEAYNPARAEDFFKSVIELKSFPAKAVHELVKETMKRHADKLTLFQMTDLIKCITSLKIPNSTYPIDLDLKDIFNTEFNYEAWRTKILELNNKLITIKIKGLDPKLVQAKFEECKYSFNRREVISASFINGGYTPIEYFFRIYGSATRFMETFSAEEKFDPKNLSAENEAKLLKLYDTNDTGNFNEFDDTRLFGSMCLMSKYKLNEKVPYHAQFVTIMGATYGMLNSTHGYKLLVQMATGQGKTILIGFRVALAAKGNKRKSKPTFMPVLTLTDDLARENAEELKPFYSSYRLTSGHDISDENTIVRYTTSRNMLFYFVKKNVEGKPFVKRDSHLFSDETDVDLWDRIGEAINTLGLELPEFTPLLCEIWNYVSSNYRFDDFQEFMQAKTAYKDLPYDLKQHFNKYHVSFYNTAKKVRDDKSLPENSSGAITTFEDSTGIVSANTYGYWGEAQFVQLKLGRAHDKIDAYSISHDRVYYRDLFEQFDEAEGYSGTLGNDCHRDVYKRLGYRTVDAAQFNAAKLVRMKPVLCEDHEFEDKVYDLTRKFTQNGQPVQIYLNAPKNVHDFCQKTQIGEAKKPVAGRPFNKLVGGEEPEDFRRIVKEATEAGGVLVSTILGGRGVNYESTDVEVERKTGVVPENKGGVVVIVATLVDTDNIQAQLEGRTARKDNNGLTISMYKRSEVVAKLNKAGIRSDNLCQDNLEEKIRLLREKLQKEKFDKKPEDEKKEDLPSELARHFYTNINPGDPKSRYRPFAFFFKDMQFAANKREEDAVIAEYNRKFNTNFRR